VFVDVREEGVQRRPSLCRRNDISHDPTVRFSVR